MDQSRLTDSGNDARADQLVRTLKLFLDDFVERVGRHHMTAVLEGNERLSGRELRQKPEQYIDERLIQPVCSVLGYEYRPQITGLPGIESKVPDFGVLNVDGIVIGEIKTPSSVTQARRQSIEYLDRIEQRPVAGIATDGLSWVLFQAHDPGERPTYETQGSLKDTLRKLRYEQHDKGMRRRRRTLRRELTAFVEKFSVEQLTSDDTTR